MRAARLVAWVLAASWLPFALVACASAAPRATTVSGSCAVTRVELKVTGGVPQPPVCVQAGTTVVAELPVNPIGQWTAPSVDNPSIAHVVTDRTARGMTLTITTLAQGHATIASHTTPAGDPVRPSVPPGWTWLLQLTVTS